ncbi:hypothetical protein [Herbaspirillum seropedicae]
MDILDQITLLLLLVLVVVAVSFPLSTREDDHDAKTERSGEKKTRRR